MHPQELGTYNIIRAYLILKNKTDSKMQLDCMIAAKRHDKKVFTSKY